MPVIFLVLQTRLVVAHSIVQIQELQKAVGDCKLFLYDEREQVLRLQAENDDLKAQEIKDRRRIQELLALTEPVTQEVRRTDAGRGRCARPLPAGVQSVHRLVPSLFLDLQMTFFRVGVAVPVGAGAGAGGPAGGSPVPISARSTSSRNHSRKAGQGPAAFGAAPGSGVPHGVTKGSWGRESFAKPPPGGGTGTSGSSTLRSGRSDGSSSGADDGIIHDVDGTGADTGMDAHEAERVVASLRSQLESTRHLADERAAAHARDRAEATEAAERKAAADAVIMTQLQKQMEVTQEKLTSLTRGELTARR